MAQHETTQKQPKRRSPAGIILLIFLLILAGTAGFLYYSVVKAPLALDDPKDMVDSVPMPVEERFCFSAADGTAQVKIDAADLWTLILPHIGEDFLDKVNRELSGYDLSVSGCAIHMDEDGLRLDLEVFYKDTRLIARVPCTLEAAGRTFSLKPTAVKLGVIPLPVGSLLSDLKLEYDINLPVISDVTEVSFVQDALVLTGSMGQDLQILIPMDQNLYKTAVFRDSLRPVADALYTEEGFAAMMSGLAQDPGKVEDLYQMLFTLADPEDAAEYLESRYGLTQRFFPDIDFSAVAAENEILNEQVIPHIRELEQLFSLFVNDYNEKNFQLLGGEFIKKKKPFDATEYGGDKFSNLFELLDPETMFLVLVNVENGYIRNTSSFYKFAPEDLEFTQEVDYNKTYILGLVFRGVSGQAYLMYESEFHEGNVYIRNITLKPLTQEQVETLQVPGKFGVWTG